MMRLCRHIFSVLFCCLLLGCAAERYHKEGLGLIAEGKVEEGLRSLEKAVEEEPTNAEYRMTLRARREEQVNRLLATAATRRVNGQWEEAELACKAALRIDAGNPRATEGLQSLARDKRHAAVLEQARSAFKKGETDKALDLIAAIKRENPSNADLLELSRQIQEQQLKHQFAPPVLRTNNKPVSLKFSDANLKMIFEALARSSGVNFILDKDVRPDLRTTLYLNQVSLEDAIDLLLQTNHLEKKILGANTVLVYPNTPEKLKEYQELVVKGFYLNNADVKQTQSMIKGLLKTKDMFVDEKLNLLVMRDTPEAIRLAEKLIAMQDLYEPEVMLELEVMEVKRSKLTELGIKWPDQISLSPIAAGSSLTLTELRNLNSDRIAASITPLTLNLHKDVTDANILANPRIRARNREKAKILIGDKVPVVTTTTTSTGFVSENVQYLDVGLKLEVEPNVYLQDEVAIKVGLEVSSLVREVRTSTGGLTYQIGTRTANTVLRLKDGETQVLAGLISDEDRSTASRVPGLGDLPVLGRLFSSQKDDRQKTEIVLSITPRLIRNINRSVATHGEFWSGTENLLRTRPLSVASVGSSSPSASDKPAGPSPLAATPSAASLGEPKAIVLMWQGPSEVKVGEQFKVALRVKADGGLRGLPFQALADPEAFEVVDVMEGPFFRQEEGQTTFSKNIDRTSGKLFVGAARSGVEGVSGEAAVVVVTLKAIAPKAQAQIRVLTATPLVGSGSGVAPTLPAPLVINVAN